MNIQLKIVDGKLTYEGIFSVKVTFDQSGSVKHDGNLEILSKLRDMINANPSMEEDIKNNNLKALASKVDDLLIMGSNKFFLSFETVSLEYDENGDGETYSHIMVYSLTTHSDFDLTKFTNFTFKPTHEPTFYDKRFE